MEILTDVLTIVTCFYCLLFIHWIKKGDESNEILKEKVNELEEANIELANKNNQLETYKEELKYYIEHHDSLDEFSRCNLRYALLNLNKNS